MTRPVGNDDCLAFACKNVAEAAENVGCVVQGAEDACFGMGGRLLHCGRLRKQQITNEIIVFVHISGKLRVVDCGDFERGGFVLLESAQSVERGQRLFFFGCHGAT